MVDLAGWPDKDYNEGGHKQAAWGGIDEAYSELERGSALGSSH